MDVTPEEQAKLQTIRVDGIVIERKKYSIVVRNGDVDREVNIPDGINIVLVLNRPLFDLQKKTVSVARAAMTPINRKQYPFEGALYVDATFAHQQQYQRIMKSEVKRLVNYTVSNKPADVATQPTEETKSLAGQLLAGSSLREYRLKTDNEQHKIILGSGGRLLGQTVLSLEPGSTFVRLVGQTDGEKLTAKEIEFWPVAPVDDTGQSTNK